MCWQGYHEYLNSSQRYYGGKRLYKELSGAKMSTFELDEKFAEIATLTGLPPLASLYDQIMACNMRILHVRFLQHPCDCLGEGT